MSKRKSRRELLKNAGISVVLGVPVEAAQHVHRAVSEPKTAKPVYKPKCFTAHEYRTLGTLAGLIIPGALEAGVPEFIDLLASNNAELAAIYTGGLAWLDRQMEKRHGARFIDATAEQQTSLLDLIAYRKNDSPELGPGIRFFARVRNMVVDAYYTSKVGIEELGYKGNGAMSEFSVPAEAVEYALKRSGL